MKVSAIAAMAQNRVIGKDNQIPWYLPADLKFFKRTTLGHHIIMGRKNFESIGFPLPKRTSVIVTRNPFYAVSRCIVVHAIEEALQVAYENGEDEAFVIGGGEIYTLAMPFLDKIYLTEIQADFEGDVFFPQTDPSIWKMETEEFHASDEKNKWAFYIRTYIRSDG